MSGKKQSVEVRINRHTMSVAGQIYQLRNLARVQCWELSPAYSRILHRSLRPTFPLLILLAVLNVLLSNGAVVAQRSLAAIDVLIIGGIGLIAAVRFLRSAWRRTQYVLILETTGNPIGVLSSVRRDVIQNLVDEIANAIENPPQTPRVFHIGDVILGDQINQPGDNAIGKVLFGA